MGQGRPKARRLSPSLAGSRPRERDPIQCGAGPSSPDAVLPCWRCAGCAFLHPARPWPDLGRESARCQELSTLAQTALDQQDYPRAQGALEQLAARGAATGRGAPAARPGAADPGAARRSRGRLSKGAGARPRIRRRADRPGGDRGAVRTPRFGAAAVRRGDRDRSPPGQGPPGGGARSRNDRPDRRGAGGVFPDAGARPERRAGDSSDRHDPASPGTSPTRRWRGSTRRWSWSPTTPRPTISAAGRTWP